jgi:L-ascorbate metabolism protein UlaG (beta-lactamase superfamily)
MKIVKWIALILAVMFIGACAINNNIASRAPESVAKSDHYKDGKFVNTTPVPSSAAKSLRILKRIATEKSVDNIPDRPLPMVKVTRVQLEALSTDRVHIVKLGHSSILAKVYGEYWLFDPAFAERASPFSFTGPKRFQPTPIKIQDLPRIDRVFISHNHYDHLDKSAISKLAHTDAKFYVPLGIDNDLRKWGVNPNNITAMDWWQEQTENMTNNLPLTIAFTPSRHFSGRGLNDRNLTLWGSWVVKVPEVSLYFSGDSGYFDGFKKIGEKYGPFDIAMIETGAYSKKSWPNLHLLPEQSVQAHIDLGGKIMLPIHNSTFDLAFHPWFEPLNRVTKEANATGVKVTTPIVGQIFTTTDQPITHRWWEL